MSVPQGVIVGIQGELFQPAEWPDWKRERLPHVVEVVHGLLGDQLPHDDRSVREQIAESANRAFPKEACGFLVSGPRGVVVVECLNVDDAPWYRFRMDEDEAAMWWNTGLVRGVWHTHPADPAVPSDGDAEMAVQGVETLIYSVLDEDLASYVCDDVFGGLALVKMEGPE